MSESSSSSRLLHLLGGPALLLLALALPIFGPIESRFGFGILFWMVWWWITCVVDIKLTCLVPIFVACVYSYMPLGKVLEAYVHREAVSSSAPRPSPAPGCAGALPAAWP